MDPSSVVGVKKSAEVIEGKGVASASLGVKSAEAFEKKEVRGRHCTSRKLPFEAPFGAQGKQGERFESMAVHLSSPGTQIFAPTAKR